VTAQIRVEDPHQFFADPDLAFILIPDPAFLLIPDPSFLLIPNPELLIDSVFGGFILQLLEYFSKTRHLTCMQY